jgi:Ca2+-binding EF-hand superfamily protein
MNKTWAVVLAALPFALLATLGSAQEPKAKPGPGNPEVMFQRLDKNQDGKITADEVPETAPDFVKEMLKRSDKNQDKVITKEEYKAGFPHFQLGAKPGPAGGSPPGFPGGPAGWQGFPPRPFAGGPQFHRPQPSAGGSPQPFAFGGPQPPFRPQAQGQQPPIPDSKAVFERLDTDKDQKLSLDEFIVGMKAFHARMRGSGRRPMAGPPGFGPMHGRPPVGPAHGMGPRGPRSAGPGAAHRPWPPMAGRPGFGRPGFGRPGFGPMHGRPPNAGMLMARLKAADKDHDGKLSKSEAPPMLQKHFDRIDGNKDGQLDRAELGKAAEAFRKHIPERIGQHRAEAMKRIEAARKHADKAVESKGKKAEKPLKPIDKKLKEKKVDKKGVEKKKDGEKKGDMKKPEDKKVDEKK